MSLSTRGGSVGALQYNATLTFTSYNNEIIKISNDAEFFSQDGRRFGDSLIRNEVGQSISSFYVYQIDGFWNSEDELRQASQSANTAIVKSDVGITVKDDGEEAKIDRA